MSPIRKLCETIITLFRMCVPAITLERIVHMDFETDLEMYWASYLWTPGLQSSTDARRIGHLLVQGNPNLEQ